MNADDYPCPACGFLVFDEPPGSYVICPICGWEDDHVQLRYPRSGGANAESLFDAQQRILREHPLEVKRIDGVERDPEWRPLTADEALSQGPANGMEYFEAAAADAPPYYWRTSRGR